MALNTNLQTAAVDLQTLRADASEALTYLDAKLATEVQVQLEALLATSGLDRKSFEELTVMLAKIKFVRFTSLSDHELTDLITNYLPLCFSLENFDLKEKIGRRIAYLGEIEAQINFMDQLAQAFAHCKQRVGSGLVTVESKKYEPSLANWIKFYFDQPAKSAIHTNMDEWSFVEQGLPTKYLSKSERGILLNILEIYDSLKNRVYEYRSMPESDNENELFKNFDLYATLPGLAINQTDSIIEGYEDEDAIAVEKPASPPVVAPPKVPTPSGQAAPQKVRMEDILATADQTRISTAAADMRADIGNGSNIRQILNEDRGKDRISNNQFPISNEKAGQADSSKQLAVSSKQIADRKSPLPNPPPQGEGMREPGGGIRRQDAGIAVMPPAIIKKNKVIPPPLLNAENLAEQMKKGKQQLADSSKQLGGAGFTQSQIDQKLEDLENRMNKRE